MHNRMIKGGDDLRKYDTVIFDLDGTLLNTLADLADSVNHVLSVYGYPQRSRDEIRAFIGNGIRKLVRRALPEQIAEETFQTVFAAFKTYYTAHCHMKTKPYDGIIEMLQALRQQGFRLAIVSNKNDAAVNELNQYFFGDLIPAAVGQKEGVPTKPAPDMVENALYLLGATKARAVYVGDSPVDKATADNVMLDCVLVSWGFCDKEVLTALAPTLLIDEPRQFLTFLNF